MKPKYRRFTRSLPLMITITLGAPCLTNAAIFNDDTGGNATPTAVDNGETTIIADGGTSLNPFVNILNGVSLNGDNGQAAVLLLSGATPYSVTVASGGSLVANSDQDGINSSVLMTLNNSGTIGGLVNGQGVQTFANGSLINNYGSITGADDAVRLNGVGGTVNNFLGGTISGNTGGASDGIQGDDAFVVFNQGSITGTNDGIFSFGSLFVQNATNFDIFGNPVSGGSIIGDIDGVWGYDSISVINQNLATITGTSNYGIYGEDNAYIQNDSGGTITGGTDAINVDNDATIINGGTITGTDNGITALDGLSVTNSGTITGTNGSGISAGANATITNTIFGDITGGTNGVSAGTGLQLTNNGDIIGGSNDGVEAAGGGNTTIINNGLISSNDDGITLFPNGAAGDVITNTGTILAGDFGVFLSGNGVILNNSGTIDSSTAVRASVADATLNFSLGSRIIGNIDDGGGNDIINLSGGLTSEFNSASGSSSNSILGNISGIETINKSGSGVAFIGVPGNGGFTISNAPTISITGGGLYINADILGGATINAGGAALGGTGTWNSTVNITAGGISAGAIPINLDLNPENAVGTLNLVGNVTHSSGTFIRHDLIPGGVDDLINHSGGTYALGANTDIRVSVTSNDTVIRNGTYTVIDSNAVITGGLPDMSVQFNPNVNDLPNLNTPGGIDLVGSLTGNTGVGNTTALINQFMSSAFTDGGTNLVFTVQHDFEGLAGLSSNASALGAALDASVNLDPTLSDGNAIIQDFIAALDYSDLGTVQATMESIIPDNVLGVATGLVSSNYRLHRVVEDHLSMARSSGGTIIETPATTDAKGGMIPAQVTSTGGGAWNVWGTVSYDWRDSEFGTTDIDGEEASFTAGIDYRVAPNLLLGILFEGSQADYDYNGGGSDIDSYRFAVYGTYGEATGLYANFLVGYGDHDIDTRRSLGGILAGSTYSAATDAESLQALLSVGYNMESGCVKHGPFAGLEYQNIDVDGFSPSGFGAFGGVGDFDVESLRLLVGYRAEATYGKFTPFGSIAYAHEFEDGPVTATATIPGGASFRFNGGGVDSAILVALGAGYAITENLSASAAYHGEFSTGDGIDSHGASIGLNYNF